MTCYQPGRSKTLSGGVVMGFTFSLKMVGTKILVPRSWYQDLGTRILVPRSWYPDLGTRILVPGSWYQDLGTRILVPRSWYQDLGTKKKGEPKRRSLSACRGARRAASSPPGGLGAFQNSRWSGGRQPPSKNNFHGKVKTHNRTSGQGFRTAWLITGQKFP